MADDTTADDTTDHSIADDTIGDPIADDTIDDTVADDTMTGPQLWQQGDRGEGVLTRWQVQHTRARKREAVGFITTAGMRDIVVTISDAHPLFYQLGDGARVRFVATYRYARRPPHATEIALASGGLSS